MSSSMGHANQVKPLSYILKNAPITVFEISVTNSDGTRRSDMIKEEDEEEEDGNKKKKDKAKIKGTKSNAAKIQFFLD